MARSIAVRLGGESSSFAFAKLDRERLYGRKERQVVDDQGRRCSSAWLSSDGAALVPAGGLAMLYVDQGFGTVERSNLLTVDAHGGVATLLPATLGVEQELEGPLPPARLLDHDIHSVFVLTAETLGDALAAALKAGKIFGCPYNFRDDHARQMLFLVANDSGLFALLGTAPGFAMVRRDAATPTETAEGDDLSDDLDFSMM